MLHSPLKSNEPITSGHMLNPFVGMLNPDKPVPKTVSEPHSLRITIAGLSIDSAVFTVSSIEELNNLVAFLDKILVYSHKKIQDAHAMP